MVMNEVQLTTGKCHTTIHVSNLSQHLNISEQGEYSGQQINLIQFVMDRLMTSNYSRGCVFSSCREKYTNEN